MFLDETPGPFQRAGWLVGGQTLVGFYQCPVSDDGVSFSEHRIGLDHLAFVCISRGELETWEVRLEELGIANGGIADADYGSALSFRDPDNIALESSHRLNRTMRRLTMNRLALGDRGQVWSATRARPGQCRLAMLRRK
jgi:catechol-2,3-dioxygenase